MARSVASYNRGMKLAHRAGDIRVRVVVDHMQRAPQRGSDRPSRHAVCDALE
jgi:hydroxymethylglutaryl-CoA reductase